MFFKKHQQTPGTQILIEQIAPKPQILTEICFFIKKRCAKEDAVPCRMQPEKQASIKRELRKSNASEL